VTQIICGVDVSASALDARIGRDGAWRRFEATAEGLDALIDFCRAHRVGLVAMEATGGYERRPFARLWAAGVPSAIVNPRAVRDFAKAMGLLEKTDRLDAGVIAWYAEARRVAPCQPASANQRRLAALTTRLRQLTELRVGQVNQRRLVTEPGVAASFQAVLAVVARETRALEAEIAALISADPMWGALDQAFRTVTGVAARTVARLLAELPEIGTLSNKAVSKLVGLAPLARDSGTRAGRRAVRGGREGVRSILFVVAELVRRHDPDFAAFHRRLTDAGKPPKLVRVALAHKLLVRLNAKARDARNQRAQTA